MATTEYRTCGKCDRYSRSLLRCIDGKANPRTLKGTIQAIRVMGASYICRFSKWKERAIKQSLKV